MAISEFNELQQQELRNEDAEAWRAVCGILLAIVCLGVSIALLALFCIF